MKVYLVGGAVRNKLMNINPTDNDWLVVGADYQTMINNNFIPVFAKSFPVFLHPITKQEYALARTEKKIGKGYKGFECYSSFTVSLQEDLSRRDFTINAIAIDENGLIIDPFNGQKDIKNRCIRHVSPAFIQDPLRVLRGARFLATFYYLNFYIHKDTLHLMSSIVQELPYLSKERITLEIQKSCISNNPEQFFNVLHKIGAFKYILTELQDIDQCAYLTIKRNKKNSLITVIACIILHLNKEKSLSFLNKISLDKRTKKIILCIYNLYNIQFFSPIYIQNIVKKIDKSITNDLLIQFENIFGYRERKIIENIILGLQNTKYIISTKENAKQEVLNQRISIIKTLI